MKYLNLFIWMFILGEIIGYIGSALMGVSYDATVTSLFSGFLGTIGVLALLYASRKGE